MNDNFVWAQLEFPAHFKRDQVRWHQLIVVVRSGVRDGAAGSGDE